MAHPRGGAQQAASTRSPGPRARAPSPRARVHPPPIMATEIQATRGGPTPRAKAARPRGRRAACHGAASSPRTSRTMVNPCTPRRTDSAVGPGAAERIKAKAKIKITEPITTAGTITPSSPCTCARSPRARPRRTSTPTSTRAASCASAACSRTRGRAIQTEGRKRRLSRLEMKTPCEKR